MILELRLVKKCDDGSYGTFSRKSRYRALIQISQEKNRTLAEYSATLLHELLHFYMALLDAKGFQVPHRKEHLWIADCEDAIIGLMRKRLKGEKK